MPNNPAAAKTLDMLDMLVPFRILDLVHLRPEQRIALAHAAWEPIISCEGTGKKALTGGAALMFGGPTYQTELSALITVIAVCAYQPGGITVFGRHWCTDHRVCLDAERQAADDGPPLLDVVSEPEQPTGPTYRGRPVVDIQLPEVA